MKKIITLLSGIIVFTFTFSSAVASPTPGIFSDVGDDEIYKDGIEFLYIEGIVNGYPDGTYQPERTLNRAEMMKIIAEGYAIKSGQAKTIFDSYSNQSCFSDVSAGQWYTKYICYGKANGWVVGYDGGTTFKPSQTVTFVEGLKIAFKGFGLTYTETSTPWYRDAVEAASRENYIPFDITGFNNGLKRNQMADLATRIIKGSISEEELAAYLGDRADKVVTYETIEAGIDVSKMESDDVTPGDEDSGIDEENSQTYNIDITAAGFSQNTLIINSGDTVIFINEDTAAHWPASAVHPTHTVYPGSDIQKCGGTEEIFDACHGLEQNETFEFTFDELGTWNYHDHLNPSVTGSITVE